ncbi:MAG: DUF4416 family protein [bacterium]
MGVLKVPQPVKFLTAVTYSHHEILIATKKALENRFDKIDLESPPFAFDHTRYYEKEMGPNLRKQFFSFAGLHERERLIELKLYSLELEKKYSRGGKRQANMDPGYLELCKLVVSSTKNFDHRIYLGQGVFGDVQLRFRKGEFITNDWTYPDYHSQTVINFLLEVRAHYYKQLNQLIDGKDHLQASWC